MLENFQPPGKKGVPLNNKFVFIFRSALNCMLAEMRLKEVIFASVPAIVMMFVLPESDLKMMRGSYWFGLTVAFMVWMLLGFFDGLRSHRSNSKTRIHNMRRQASLGSVAFLIALPVCAIGRPGVLGICIFVALVQSGLAFGYCLNEVMVAKDFMK